MIAASRYIFYRTIPDLMVHKKFRAIVFPPLSVLFIGFAGVTFSLLYTFVPQPLFWQSIEYGSPPVAIRSGMLAVALLPWVVAMAMKANIVTIITGIGHERLNVLHRWGAYLMLLLSLIHTIPFYMTPITNNRGHVAWEKFFDQDGIYIYGSGK
jgi:predicted ferric reductase